jgi:hypothetical protein
MATCNAGFLTVSPGVSNPGPPGTVRRRSPTELRPTSGSRPLGHFRVRGRRTPRWPVLDGRVSNLLEVGRECQPLLNGSRQSRAECVRPVQAPLGTSQAGRKDLLFVFFAQDIHRRRIILRLSQCPGSAISLAAFQVSTDGRFWVSTEARVAFIRCKVIVIWMRSPASGAQLVRISGGVSSTVRRGVALFIRQLPNGARAQGSARLNSKLSHLIDQRGSG